MPDLLERDFLAPLHVDGDEQLARTELRRQIGRLERELAGLFAEAFPRVELDCGVSPGASEPRVLDLGELERVRDDLATRIGEARVALDERSHVETRNRELLRQMLADPAKFKWVRISNRDIGGGGCGHFHSRPRLGVIGMLMGWWQVKISSGCPLSGRLAAVEQEAKQGT